MLVSWALADMRCSGQMLGGTAGRYGCLGYFSGGAASPTFVELRLTVLFAHSVPDRAAARRGLWCGDDLAVQPPGGAAVLTLHRPRRC